MWVLIKSAKRNKPKLSRIVQHFDLELDTFRMIPVESIQSPVLVQKDTLNPDHLVEAASCFIIQYPDRWSENLKSSNL